MKDVKLSQVVLTGTNPRKHFDEERSKELIESIRKHGIMVPLIVREKKGALNQFELISGERRFKAAQALKLAAVPAIIKDLNDEQVLETQLIENLQRNDLTPLEEASGFKALMDKCKCTQEDIAKKIGKTQGYIAARISLLDLRQDFQKLLDEDKLLPGHIKFMANFKGSNKILDNLLKRMKDLWKHSEMITVREFETLCIDVTRRQTKQLYKSTYAGDDNPLFDLKACEKCQWNKTANIGYEGIKKRCFNPECFNEKQSTIRRAEAERIRAKVKSGKMVKEEDLPQDTQTFDHCKFDKKSCAKCARSVGMVKDYQGKKVKKEICLDKECYKRKEKEAHDAAQKAEQEAFKKQVAKCKERAAKGKTDRAFMILLVVEVLNNTYGSAREAAMAAYGFKDEAFRGSKKTLEYFTRNTKVNVDEVLRFLTYWKD